MKNLISQFIRNDAGSTIEFVLWLPVFMLILSLITDSTLIFFGQSRVYQVTQVANRAYSIGNFEAETEVATYIENAVAQMGAQASVNTSVTDGIIHTVVTVPARNFEAIGFFSVLSNIQLTVASDFVMEAS